MVEKYELPKAYNLMNELIWNKRSGPIDEEFKESVIAEIYKFDSRIDAGMWWKIRRVQEVGRERRREVRADEHGGRTVIASVLQCMILPYDDKTNCARNDESQKMIKKKEEAVNHRTFQIIKKKTKIRQTKAR